MFKRHWLVLSLLLIALIAAACGLAATPMATPVPPTPTKPPPPPGTPTPAPTAAVAASRLSLTSPTLPERLGVGDARVEYRPVVGVRESTFVRLVIAAAPELASIKTAPVTKKTADDPGFVYKVSPSLDLFPWMWAELQFAPGSFQSTPAGRQRKPVIVGRPTEWVWSLIPAQGRGQQDLVIRIGTLVTQPGKAELEIETAESITLSITILEPTPTAVPPPTPTSIPTPGDSLTKFVADWAPIITAVIGAIGAIVVALIQRGRSKKSE